MPIIKFENVSKTYQGNFLALDNVSFSIESGEFVSIVGHSGAGKSTLLKMIYAEERPSEGQVYFNDRPINDIKQKQLPYFRRSIGTVFQESKLLSQKTAFENVAFALEVEGRETEEINEEVPKILDIVGLSERMEKFPHQLSGGEKQKVALARALINRPQAIVADEPTGNLDPVSSWEIIQLFLKINDYGTTVILATHNKEIVDKIHKRVIVMEKGKIVHDQAKGKYVM